MNKLTNISTILWLLIIATALFIFWYHPRKYENFYDFQYPHPFIFEDVMGNLHNINEPIYTPFERASMRHTRNQSYDLRGDELPIPPREYIWNNSTIRPH